MKIPLTDIDVTDGTFKEMFEILSAPLPTERIKYRRQVAASFEARRSFVNLDKKVIKRGGKRFIKNPNVFFQHLEYSVGQE